MVAKVLVEHGIQLPLKPKFQIGLPVRIKYITILLLARSEMSRAH